MAQRQRMGKPPDSPPRCYAVRMGSLGQLVNATVMAIVLLLAAVAALLAVVGNPSWWLVAVPLVLLFFLVGSKGASVVLFLCAIVTLVAGFASSAWWWLGTPVLLVLAALAENATEYEDDEDDEYQRDVQQRSDDAGLATGLAAGYIAHEVLDDDSGGGDSDGGD